MLVVLAKLFVRSFYRANAGFFLFFFFLFFGAVDGGSLVSYHLSLMRSMLTSTATLTVVFVCWLLYHAKCISFFLKTINREESTFLLAFQAVEKSRQWLLCFALYMAVYAPVFVYATIVAAVGFRTGFTVAAASIISFQLIFMIAFAGILAYRLNHWIDQPRFTVPRLPMPKTLSLLLLSYYLRQRKSLLLVVKFFSLALLYIILVWNRGKYDHDSFLLFYLVLLLAQASLPYFAVQFWERRFGVYRNLPVPLVKRAWAFLLPLALLLVPEVSYILIQADAFSGEQRLGYCVNLLASLSLMTALQYSEAQTRDEYLKACFAIIFLSIFILHVQAVWFWIGAQFLIAALLFANGYHKFELKNE